jgi:hypothetical protein
MEHCYKFAVLRLSPIGSRDERLNIGVAVFQENFLDLRIAKRLEKVKSISNAIDVTVLRSLVDNLKKIDSFSLDRGENVESRRLELSMVSPISLSKLGQFTAYDLSSYERRLETIFTELVDPEQAPFKPKVKRSKILSQMKSLFKQEGVLAQKDDTIDSHRIITRFEIDTGLVADMALKNGAMHIVETVNAIGDEQSIRKVIGEIGVAALVLERSRMKFGIATKAKLVYDASVEIENFGMAALQAAENQGAELVNWASADDRRSFIHVMSSFATRINDRPTHNLFAL